MKSGRFFKDIINRKLFIKKEIFQRVLKLFFFYKIEYQNELENLIFLLYSIIMSKVKFNIRNYCVISGRPRGIYQKFKVSRFFFRELGSQGMFVGLKKAS